MSRGTRAAAVLTCIIAGLATLAAAVGLMAPSVYRDNPFVVSTWLGNDAVTLVVGVPLLVGAMVSALRGSARARLVWVGMLDYMLYNFAFYLFGSAFNRLFLVYAAVFALSIWALVCVLVPMDVAGLARMFGHRTPARPVAGFMLFVGGGLATVYIAQWLGFAITGDVPVVVERTAHPTNVVFALDLSLVVPALVVGALWLWRRRPWGYVLAAAVNVKGAIYMVALCAATVTAYREGTIDSVAEIGLWGAIGAGSLAAAWALLWNMRAASRLAERRSD